MRRLLAAIRQRWRWARGIDVAAWHHADPWQRRIVRYLRVIWLVARWEVYERVTLHAQALTYDTLLAIVPLLAVVMAVVKGFGGMAPVANQLQDFIVDNISGAPDVQSALVSYLRDFVVNLETSNLGAVSVLLLIFSVLSLLGHIESAINVIFGVRSQRPMITRFLTYWGILTLGPMLLAASFGMTATLGSVGPAGLVESLGELHFVMVHAASLLMTWVGFTGIYLLVPYTAVPLRAAVPAAIVAGTFWHVGKFLYAIYASHAFTLHNIYGSLATVPLFILWLYVSWLLVLFGAQLAFALQHARTYRGDEENAPASIKTRDLVICRLYLEVARDFFGCRPPRGREALAAQLQLSIRLVEDLVSHLTARGFLRETGPERQLVPGRDLAQVSINDLLHTLHTDGSPPHLIEDEARRFLSTLLHSLDAAQAQQLAAMNFRDLAAQFLGPAGPAGNTVEAVKP